VPEQVSVALGELVGEGLVALAVGTGLRVLTAMMEAEVTAACGPEGRHDPARSATRHGHEAGSVSLGAGVGCLWCGLECAPPTAPVSWRWRPSGGWPWSGCWPGCPRRATRSGSVARIHIPGTSEPGARADRGRWVAVVGLIEAP
jgi:hypothetical protein